MKKFELLDVCYPDYFSGYHRPVLAVPVFNNMYLSELASGLELELNSTFDYLTNESNGFTKTEILIIEEYIKELKDQKDDVFIGEQFEELDNDIDCVYAYFSITKPVYSNGIRFLY